MKKRYCELMEQISLDETAKARMLERLAAGEKKRRRAPLRTALVAACVCLGVVAGALAADVIFGVPVFREVDYAVDGEIINGFTTVLTDGESAETRGVPKYPETVFNPQVLEDAANSDGALEFATLEEAEAVRRKVSDIASDPQYRDEIVSFVKENGGLEYAVRRLEEYIDDAVKALEVLPESYEKQYLVELAHYTGKRNM